MIKQQQSLQNIYMKQTKVNKNIESAREDLKFQIEEKHEKETERKQHASEARKKVYNSKFQRIQSAIARKENNFMEQGDKYSMSAKSAQGKVWKGLAIKDQQDKISRMNEV